MRVSSGNDVSQFHDICAHPLAGSEQTVSVLGALPYVNPGKYLYGSDIDLISTVAEKIGFKIKFKRERSFPGIIEAVNKNITSFTGKELVSCWIVFRS